MSTVDPIVFISFARTPIGNLLGVLKPFSAHALGAAVIRACYERAQISAEIIDEVMMGCVLPAGQGQAPARQAAIGAALPHRVPCTTINKVCGSGMKAMMSINDSLLLNHITMGIGGGMESMTNAPYLLLKARSGYRLGADKLYDHMTLDGLEDAYEIGRPMGYFAEQCVKAYGFTRKQQDDYAFSSFERAQYAIRERLFEAEITPLSYQAKEETIIIDTDEHPFSVNPEKISKLSPIFLKDGSVTAGNSSSIADGAAALLLTRASHAEKQGVAPIARLVAHTTCARTPAEFTIAPIDAIKKLLQLTAWNIHDVDLFEINEAFAAVTLAAMYELKIPREKVNIHGGACALGHPIGASGARLVVTLLSALQQNGLKRGIASLCIGGGEATAVAVEMI